MTDSTLETEDHTEKSKTTTIAALLACAAMTLGGLFAFGGGGALLGFGFWLMIAASADEITESIEKSR